MAWWLARVVSAGALFGLAGCIDVHETITVKPGGGFELVREMRVERRLYDRLSDSDRGNLCDDRPEQAASGVRFGSKSEFVPDFFVCRAWIVADAVVGHDGAGIMTSEVVEGVRQIRVAPGEKIKATPLPDDEMGRAAIREAFIGKSYRVELNAPKILASNGRLDPDGRRATWEVPMLDLFAGVRPDRAVFTAELPE